MGDDEDVDGDEDMGAAVVLAVAVASRVRRLSECRREWYPDGMMARPVCAGGEGRYWIDGLLGRI